MSNVPDEIEITAPVSSEYAEILSPAAIAFLADLQRTFGVRRKELLAARVARQTLLDAGVKPDFLPETKHYSRRQVALRPNSNRYTRSPCRDHWTCRSQDDHQRAELRRSCVHGGF